MNIDTYAPSALSTEESANVPAQVNIDTYAANALSSEQNTNVSSQANIDTFIDIFGNFTTSDDARDKMLSKNKDFVLGVDVAFGGTSAFLGVSNLLIQGAIINNIMTIPNKYNLLTHQYSGPTGVPKAPNTNYGYKTLDDAAFRYRDNLSLNNKVEGIIENSLLFHYSVAQNEPIFIMGFDDGTFPNATSVAAKQITAPEGDLTTAIRNYNIARNYYSVNNSVDIVAAQKTLKSILDTIANTQASGKYAQYTHNEQGTTLINTYLGTDVLKGAQYKPKEKTNTSPDSMQSYLGNPGGTGQQYDAVDMLKPNSFLINNSNAPNYSAGTAGSMMAQTQVSEAINNRFLKGETAPTKNSFGTTTRGVRHIIDIISQDGAIPIAQNYVRGQNEFVVGIKDSTTPRLSYQRYTYNNPYSSQGVYQQKLDFAFTNYANGITMYFPPYIKGYRHDASANWNSHEFLGRPEPVYTYNNGNRTGSISFVVLTDYAETFNYGSIDENGNIATPYTTNYNFTSQQQSQLKLIQAAIISEQNNISALNSQISALSGNSIAISDLQTQIANAQTNISGYQQIAKSFQNGSPRGNPYHEFGGGSDYSKSISAAQTATWEYVNTKTYLDDIKKNLMFIPSYFSGSKVDFVTKMDFLQKMTRPARSSGGTSFMFTTPPVCHIKLGDWFDWDIVVENVSFDYTDSNWTLDDNFGGRVQPMFATVDVSFKIVGSYGGGGTPVLATDTGGFFTLKS